MRVHMEIVDRRHLPARLGPIAVHRAGETTYVIPGDLTAEQIAAWVNTLARREGAADGTGGGTPAPE